MPSAKQKFDAERTAKLHNGNIFDHLQHIQELEQDADNYFYASCPLLDAIRQEIQTQTTKRLFSPPEGLYLFYHRGHGPVSFKEKYLRGFGDNLGFYIDVTVSVGTASDNYSSDVEIKDHKFTLNPPFSLLKKFDQKVFDKWADEVKAEREKEENEEDLKALKALIKRHPKEAKALLRK